MKKLFATMMITFALAAVAAPPVKYWNTPMDAVDHDKQVERKIRNYQNQGFIMLSVEENPYMYMVTPEGDYTWGTVQVKLRSQSTGMSLETTYVTITCYVEYVASEDGYTTSGFDVIEETVY